MLLREVLQTTHPKYCWFSLVTGFYLLFELAGAVRTEEDVAFAQFLAALTGLPFSQPLLTERHSQGELQATSAMRWRYIYRSQRKPLNVGKERTFDHVSQESIWPVSWTSNEWAGRWAVEGTARKIQHQLIRSRRFGQSAFLHHKAALHRNVCALILQSLLQEHLKHGPKSHCSQ